jgi:hypothetical protein
VSEEGLADPFEITDTIVPFMDTFISEYRSSPEGGNFGVSEFHVFIVELLEAVVKRFSAFGTSCPLQRLDLPLLFLPPYLSLLSLPSLIPLSSSSLKRVSGYKASSSPSSPW